jgi:hypothetical protein
MHALYVWLFPSQPSSNKSHNFLFTWFVLDRSRIRIYIYVCCCEHVVVHFGPFADYWYFIPNNYFFACGAHFASYQKYCCFIFWLSHAWIMLLISLIRTHFPSVHSYKVDSFHHALFEWCVSVWQHDIFDRDCCFTLYKRVFLFVMFANVYTTEAQSQFSTMSHRNVVTRVGCWRWWGGCRGGGGGGFVDLQIWCYLSFFAIRKEDFFFLVSYVSLDRTAAMRIFMTWSYYIVRYCGSRKP